MASHSWRAPPHVTRACAPSQYDSPQGPQTKQPKRFSNRSPAQAARSRGAGDLATWPLAAAALPHNP